MSSQSEQHDVAVVGGGVIGLAVAWRAAQRGLRTLVLDAGEDGAWRYAAGMLAPVTEAEFGEQALLDLGLRAAAGFPDFCAELEQASGRDPGLRLTGTLVVARDRDEAEALDAALRLPPEARPRGRAAAADRRRGAPSPRSPRPSGSRSTCPATARSTRASSWRRWPTPSRPREARSGGACAAVDAAGGRRRSSSPERRTVAAQHVVVAAGAWSGKLGDLPIRPVKGQIMRLRDPRGEDLVTRTIRTPRGLPRPARRGQLRARRDGRGARLGHRADRRRHPRADPRPRRGRPRRARARDRGARRRPAPRHARQPAGDRRARRRDLGHRPLPQRDPARRRHRRGGRGAPGGNPLPEWAAACDPARFAEVHA